MRTDSVRTLTWLARHPGAESMVIDGLEQVAHRPEAQVALVELASRPGPVRVRVRAVRRLGHHLKPWIIARLWTLTTPETSGPLRLETFRCLGRRAPDAERLLEAVRRDQSPIIRRTALGCLVREGPSPQAWAALDAAMTDPVWRVRRDATRALMVWGKGAEPEPVLAWLRSRLSARPPRAQAAAWALTMLEQAPEIPPPPATPWVEAPWWDEDPAMRLERLRHLDPETAGATLPALIQVAALQDGYPLDDTLEATRRCVRSMLLAQPKAVPWGSVIDLLEDPRLPYAARWAEETLQALVSQAPEVAKAVMEEARGRGGDAQRWAEALEAQKREPVQAAEIPWLDRPMAWWVALPDSADPELKTRAAKALVEAVEDPETETETETSLTPTHLDTLEALAADPDPWVQAAALTHARAEALWASLDTAPLPAWPVITAAAERLGHDLAEVAPEGLAHPPISPGPTEPPLNGPYFPLVPDNPRWRPPAHRPASITPPHGRLIGGRLSAPLVISGRYGLSEAGFEHALAHGANAFFWEPEYVTLTRWIRSLSPARRAELVLIGGSFQGEVGAVQRDIDAMRRTLGVEQVAAYVLFWVRSAARLDGPVAEALYEATIQGHLGTFGLSTHSRALAVEAAQAGWETVMVRHSGGHPGAEEAVFPEAMRLGAQVITFSALCYGQMLKARDGQSPPYEAADCYRYSLSQPGVTVTLTAPRTMSELKHNLTVLERPTLSDEAQARLRAFAAPVRGETRTLIDLLRF